MKKENEAVSKNFVRGIAITHGNDVLDLAYNQKSLYSYRFGVCPAAFVASMQFRLVQSMIDTRQLFRIKKKEKKDD